MLFGTAFLYLLAAVVVVGTIAGTLLLIVAARVGHPPRAGRVDYVPERK